MFQQKALYILQSQQDREIEIPHFYVLSWNAFDLDRAAGFASNALLDSDLSAFPSVGDWNALNIPPFEMGSFFPGLIPNVLHIELFAAASGSSILSVLGIQRLFSCFSSSCEFKSLECFPRGDVFPELPLFPEQDAGLLGASQPQVMGDTNGKVIFGMQNPGGLIIIVGEFQGTRNALLGGRAPPYAAIPFQPKFQGYGGGPGNPCKVCKGGENPPSDDGPTFSIRETSFSLIEEQLGEGKPAVAPQATLDASRMFSGSLRLSL